MGHAQRILPSYTYDDYVHWEGRWELIDGIPFAMSPLPSPKHQRIASGLNFEFVKAIKEAGCKKCTVYEPLDFKVAEDTILQPDILIVCEKISKPFLDFAPGLVVEILSPSTALRDRHTKFDLYESTGVKYYIIVDTEKEIFELYELTNGKYVVKQKAANAPTLFDLDDHCSISVQLDEVWS